MTGLVIYLACCIFNRRLVNLSDFFDWAIRRVRTFWIVFFSLLIGLSVTEMARFDLFSEGWLLFLSINLMFAASLLQVISIENHPVIERTVDKIVEIDRVVEVEKTVEVEKIIEKQLPARPRPVYGTIYIIRRDDGVLKFGKAVDLRVRLRTHNKDYGSKFNVIASWIVPNVDRYERIILQMSERHHFSEGKRKELRQMTDSELSRIILEFTEKVQKGFNYDA